jgi:hypothetical protein
MAALRNPGELLVFGNPPKGHKRGCKCFACKRARGENPACGSRFRKSTRSITDRAARYRANSPDCRPPGEKRCAFCGTKKNIDVCHLDGHEKNTDPRNLTYGCRSCNVKAANRMRRAGMGTRASQTNPSEGAKTLAQWVTAVMSMKGESDAMPVGEAVDIIRATPHSRRSTFAREIWRKRKRSGNPGELLIFGNPADPRISVDFDKNAGLHGRWNWKVAGTNLSGSALSKTTAIDQATKAIRRGNPAERETSSGKFLPSTKPVAIIKQVAPKYFVLTMGGKEIGSDSRARAERHARAAGYTVKYENPSKLERQRAARDRAAKIRSARANQSYVYFSLNGREYRTDGQTVEGKDGQTWNRTGSLPVVLAGRKAWAARSEKNPTHMQVTFDRGIGKFLAYLYDPKFGNLYATGFTKKQAAKALHEEVRRVRRTGSWRNPKRSTQRRRRNDRQHVGDHQGIAMYFEGISYNAPALKLYGYSTDLALKRAIDRKLKKRAGNPDETKQAVKLFQSFHGRDPKDIAEKHVSAEMRKDYAAVGALEYLKVMTPLGQTAQFNFDGDGVTLASSPDGKQLYCIGGNQNLSQCLTADSLAKDFIDLGECIEVQYLARKIHGNFEPVSYFHKFGEKTGERPQLAYDKLKKQIFFVGGAYFINAKQGVSPGIEN